MVVERYLEFLALKQLTGHIDMMFESRGKRVFMIDNGEETMYDYDKFYARINALSKELLEPYVIESSSKE